MTNENGILINPATGEWVGVELPISPLPETAVGRVARLKSCVWEEDLELTLTVEITYVYADTHPEAGWRGRPVLDVQEEELRAGRITATRYLSYTEQFRPATRQRTTRGAYLNPQTGARLTASGAAITPANTPGAMPERQFFQLLTAGQLAPMGVSAGETLGRQVVEMMRAMIADLDSRGAF